VTRRMLPARRRIGSSNPSCLRARLRGYNSERGLGEGRSRGLPMAIELGAELETLLREQASRRRMSPETLAQDILRHWLSIATHPIVPRDDWERRLRAIATDCGVSLSDEAVSSEGLYE
jgi:hypothetical protein